MAFGIIKWFIYVEKKVLIEKQKQKWHFHWHYRICVLYLDLLKSNFKSDKSKTKHGTERFQWFWRWSLCDIQTRWFVCRKFSTHERDSTTGQIMWCNFKGIIVLQKLNSSFNRSHLVLDIIYEFSSFPILTDRRSKFFCPSDCLSQYYSILLCHVYA